MYAVFSSAILVTPVPYYIPTTITVESTIRVLARCHTLTLYKDNVYVVFTYNADSVVVSCSRQYITRIIDAIHVIEELYKKGYTIVAPQCTLLSLNGDILRIIFGWYGRDTLRAAQYVCKTTKLATYTPYVTLLSSLPPTISEICRYIIEDKPTKIAIYWHGVQIRGLNFVVQYMGLPSISCTTFTLTMDTIKASNALQKMGYKCMPIYAAETCHVSNGAIDKLVYNSVNPKKDILENITAYITAGRHLDWETQRRILTRRKLGITIDIRVHIKYMLSTLEKIDTCTPDEKSSIIYALAQVLDIPYNKDTTLTDIIAYYNKL